MSAASLLVTVMTNVVRDCMARLSNGTCVSDNARVLVPSVLLAYMRSAAQLVTISRRVSYF